MNRSAPLMLIFFSLFFNSCGYKERENAIKQKEETLLQKEQQLMLWEKNLQLKEDSIKLLIARRDSSSFADSIALPPPSLIGEWTAKMVCIKTSCAGSAIGDVQTDTWQITSQDSALIIKSVTRGQVNRIYTGNYYRGHTIRVTVSSDDPALSDRPSRLVEITDIRDNKMKGTRIVTQPDGCQIHYSLDLDKKQ